MTINVVVATYHAVVLGCDSLSSVVERAYFPFRSGASIALDANGQPIRDASGNLTIPYLEGQLVNTATNIMGGVQKMFLLHQSPDERNVECSVAAMTSGLGTLNGVTIAELAARYSRFSVANDERHPIAEGVALEFMRFVRPLWETEVSFANTAEELRQFLPDLNFMIVGYGEEDAYTKVFRVSIAQNSCVEQFPDAPHCSAAWAGQTSTVAKLINGIDPILQFTVTKTIVETLVAQRQSIVESVIGALRDQGVTIPDPFDATVVEVVPPTLPWSNAFADINWANLPSQHAVDLVSTLVNAESGMQKFAMGIPMVGGRTRIGLIRRNLPFTLLNEPAIVHSHVGYSSDA